MTAWTGSSINAGAGSLSVAAKLALVVTSSFAGAGSLSVSVQATIHASLANLVGVGGLSVSATWNAIVILFVGQGGLFVATNTILAAPTSFAGNSKVCAFASVLLATRGVVNNVARTGSGPTNNVIV